MHGEWDRGHRRRHTTLSNWNCTICKVAAANIKWKIQKKKCTFLVSSVRTHMQTTHATNGIRFHKIFISFCEFPRAFSTEVISRAYHSMRRQLWKIFKLKYRYMELHWIDGQEGLWPTLALQFCSWVLTWMHRKTIYSVLLGVACTDTKSMAQFRPWEQPAMATLFAWHNSPCARAMPIEHRIHCEWMPKITSQQSRSFIFYTVISPVFFLVLFRSLSRFVPICIFKIILSMKIELILSGAAVAAVRWLAANNLICIFKFNWRRQRAHIHFDSIF